jgi:hypothetical protein
MEKDYKLMKQREREEKMRERELGGGGSKGEKE